MVSDWVHGCVQGGEEQLKEVWEESDGLNKKDFDPRTFFHLHGQLLLCAFSSTLSASSASVTHTHTHKTARVSNELTLLILTPFTGIQCCLSHSNPIWTVESIMSK